MKGPVILGYIDKNKNDKVRVALDEYRGTPLVDVRICVELTQACGVLTPTGKGVALNVALLPQLIDLLVQARTAAIDAGLLTAPE